jgi:hypothetical protein
LRQLRRFVHPINADKVFGAHTSNERERNILAAMVEAHERSEAGARVDKVFEVASWLVKPLH